MLFAGAEFQIPVVTGQLELEGEEMSAPRPFMTQITFIHSILSVVRINFCIDRKGFKLFLPCGVCLGAVRI